MRPLGDVTQLVELIGAAHHILIFTGAGVATASGIPDFRGPGGVWTRRRPRHDDRPGGDRAGVKGLTAAVS